jgi:hypothetical protein
MMKAMDWFKYADTCYGKARDRADQLEHDLKESLTDEQAKQLDELLGTAQQVEEIDYHTIIEQTLVHLADPSRAFRAVYIHLVEGGVADASACCAEPPELPFNEDDA